MTEPDNLILVHLRELRAEMAATREELRGEIKAAEERMTRRLQTIEKRIDAMHLNGVTALRGFIGHRSMTERTMASFEGEVAALKQRVERLEGAPT